MTTIGGILPDGVVASFPHKSAAMIHEMPDQVTAFHDVVSCAITRTLDAADSSK